MTHHQRLVADFLEMAGETLPNRPTLIRNSDKAVLNGTILVEEANEVFKAIWSGSIKDIVHELADVMYVVYNIANTHGIPPEMLDRAFEEVHAANLTKVKPPVNRRADGKIVKNKHYRAPNLSFVR